MIATKSKFSLYPSSIVEYLNKHIVGQNEAKRSVALALRNRIRRVKMKKSPLKDSINISNILLIGSTGVGKTEIARQLAKMQDAPFIKVDATKFTEVGYVGKDVESIIKELLDAAIAMQKKCSISGKSRSMAKKQAMQIIAEAIVEQSASENQSSVKADSSQPKPEETTAATYKDEQQAVKDCLLKLEKGELDNTMVDIEIQDDRQKLNFSSQPFSGIDIEQHEDSQVAIGVVPINDIFRAFSERKNIKKMLVKDAIEVITEQEILSINDDSIIDKALQLTQESGIVFIDEIDKLISTGSAASRGEVSREGVQRDLLSIIEGANVTTKHGVVDTTNILFIASGAFQTAKVSDLMPELNGRFPVKVKLKNLTEDDFIKILTEPEFNSIKKYQALLAVDQIDLQFTDCGIKQIASVAFQLNMVIDNTGARRLLSVLEKVLEDISFNVQPTDDTSKIVVKIVDKQYVDNVTKSLFDDSPKKEDYIF